MCWFADCVIAAFYLHSLNVWVSTRSALPISIQLMQFCYFTSLSSRNALDEGNINSIKSFYLWFNRKFSKYIGYIYI